MKAWACAARPAFWLHITGSREHLSASDQHLLLESQGHQTIILSHFRGWRSPPTFSTRRNILTKSPFSFDLSVDLIMGASLWGMRVSNQNRSMSLQIANSLYQKLTSCLHRRARANNSLLQGYAYSGLLGWRPSARDFLWLPRLPIPTLEISPHASASGFKIHGQRVSTRWFLTAPRWTSCQMPNTVSQGRRQFLETGRS